MDIISQLLDFLESLANDPVAYLVIFYIFCVLAAIILPIPVEFGLFLNPEVNILIKALVLGLGKATGAALIFYLGIKVEGPIRNMSRRWEWFRRFVDLMDRFVCKTRYIGLYILLSIPLMTDTVPIYLFSVFNKEGKALGPRWFTLTNFLAGVTRAMAVYIVFLIFGVKLL
jgi:hypothetical protein